MLKPAAAWSLIEAELDPLPPIAVERERASLRVLALDQVATVDQPPADVSAMDGFALSGPPTVGEPLEIVDVAAAGRPAQRAVGAQQAIKIMTGAVLPSGADRVVAVEQTALDPTGRVISRVEVGAQENIRRQGEVIRRGDLLMRQGKLLTPGAIALAAGHGLAKLPIFRPPRVAVLTTGDEIVPPDASPGPGQLRDSNTSFLVAACQTLGLEVENLGVCPDDRFRLRELMVRGLQADVFLLCGGVSQGDFDFVEEVLGELGCRPLFDAVAIQPGKPLVVARHPTGWAVGLPGNPASVMTCFWLFVRPLLRRLQGLPDGFWHGALAGRLTAPAHGARQRDRFLPATVEVRQGEIAIHPIVPVGSHDVMAFAGGTALLRVASASGLAAGDPAEILPLGHWPVG